VDDLLRAVLESPCDVVLRLAYADWLEERGEGRDRAWLIRDMAGGPARDEVRRRVVLATLGARIMDALRPALKGTREAEGAVREAPRGEQVVEMAWRGGFVMAASCRAEVWGVVGPALCAMEPVTFVRLAPSPVRERLNLEGVRAGAGRAVGGGHFFCLLRGRHWRMLAPLRGLKYASRKEAERQASLCAVNWARKRAGLRPLGPGEAPEWGDGEWAS
jgi:uncharacterized protein (TIGR02996 family)